MSLYTSFELVVHKNESPVQFESRLVGNYWKLQPTEHPKLRPLTYFLLQWLYFIKLQSLFFTTNSNRGRGRGRCEILAEAKSGAFFRGLCPRG